MQSDFPAQLRAASLRVTQPRLAVLAVLQDHPHVDTETVISLVRSAIPTVSQQTVYDVLHALTAAARVERRKPASGGVPGVGRQRSVLL